MINEQDDEEDQYMADQKSMPNPIDSAQKQQFREFMTAQIKKAQMQDIENQGPSYTNYLNFRMQQGSPNKKLRPKSQKAVGFAS